MAQNEKLGVREIVDVVFKAKSDMQIGNVKFKKGQPVIYFDSAKTSSLESTTATVYAQGGRGNARLLAWEGDKTITFTFEEALISARSFALLSGANLTENTRVHMHQYDNVQVTQASVDLDGKTPAVVNVLDLTPYLPEAGQIMSAADESLVDEKGIFKYQEAGVYVMELDEHGAISRTFDVTAGPLKAQPTSPAVSTVAKSQKIDSSELYETTKFMLVSAIAGDTATEEITGDNGLDSGKTYLVDYYVMQPGDSLSISPGKFAGNFLIEANTLFRRQSDGRDLPAQFTIPNGKISSAFTFTMASSGDPSTFPFQVEAFPDYLPFNKKCKFMVALDIASEPVANDEC